MTGYSELASERPIATRRRLRRFSISGIVRWLHLYVSLIGFLAMLFFAITGITLNHPTWFGESTRTTTHRGQLPPGWLGRSLDDTSVAEIESPSAPERESGIAVDKSPADAEVDKLAIVEFLRATHGLRGMVKEFLVDDEECSIAMNGPGYSADTWIDRQGGAYEVTVVEHGPIAVWNDLHKGRDTGVAWSWVIDVSAAIMSVSCITGLAMLMFMRRKRLSGSLWTAIGATLFIVIAKYLVK